MNYIMGNKKIRTEKEIKKYMEEAFDKVWFMRSHPCDNIEIEKNRKKAIERILREYPECRNGFSDWDCGYWNGILASLRWVLMDEKDFLDT